MQTAVKAPQAAAVRNDGQKQPARKNTEFGIMVCFHPRYRLGARHGFGEPRDFLVELVSATLEDKAIVDYVLAGHCEGLQLQWDLGGEAWDIIVYNDLSGNWDVADTFADIQGHLPDVAAALLNGMALGDLLALARKENALLPVYLPDGSRSHLTTSLMAEPWRAGQVGWMVADRKTVQRRFHGTKYQEDRLMKAEDILRAAIEACPNPRHTAKRAATV